MNKAQEIAMIFDQRDKQIFEHLVALFDCKLSDREWLLDTCNYSRNGDNEIVYTLSVGDEYITYVESYERAMPSEVLRQMIVGHYTEQGFKVELTDRNILVLRVNGFDIGLVEDDPDATPAA